MRNVIKSLSALVEKVSELEVDYDSFLTFRGEPKDYKTALSPGIYRKEKCKDLMTMNF